MTTEYEITLSGKFKRDFKKHRKQERELKAIKDLLDILSRQGVAGVPERMKPHRLAGKYNGFWECHIFPDLLLIWIQRESPEKIVHLARLGSHAELF